MKFTLDEHSALLIVGLGALLFLVLEFLFSLVSLPGIFGAIAYSLSWFCGLSLFGIVLWVAYDLFRNETKISKPTWFFLLVVGNMLTALVYIWVERIRDKKLMGSE